MSDYTVDNLDKNAIVIADARIYRGRIAFLFQNGIQGTAILKGIEQTGVEINNIPQFRMRLEITLPDRPPYEVIHKECLNVFVTSSIKKDMKINIYVHPAKPKSIFLDWETTSDYNYPSF